MKQEEHENFERILESAVVVNWPELMRGRTGAMQIEYGLAPNATVDYLKVWSSTTRGYWLLACTYRMSASHNLVTGIHFDNGHESQGLANILDVVMQHQDQFGLTHNPGGHGLIPILAPTFDESEAAKTSIKSALGRVKAAGTPTAKLTA